MVKEMSGLRTALIIFYLFCIVYLGSSQSVVAKTADNVQKLNLYFAYGSNMDFEQMNLRCLNAEFAGLAQIDGYQFQINSRGVATIQKNSDHFVQGVLWNISDYDEAMLDLFEGVAGGFYVKENLLVKDLSSGEIREALVYLGTDLNLGDPRSGYLERIIKAAYANKLDTCYIEELEGWKSTEK